jgi:hypothetical protein
VPEKIFRKSMIQDLSNPSVHAFGATSVPNFGQSGILRAFGGWCSFCDTGSYSLGDVLYLSAIGKNKTPFTPLSLWNFGEGWLELWVPPPNGELHLQRGGWVNTPSGFQPRI